jgi:prepilin-type N-terminal cleavage/methylation domain-containing protein
MGHTVRRGFTLIELLVVIAIIGILASIVLVSLSSSKTKASAARVASDLRSIEKAFQLMAIDENASTWWIDSSLNGSFNPPLSALVADSGRLGKFLKIAPAPPVGASYFYDNDGDTATCGGSPNAGVNIFTAAGADPALLSQLDEIFDQGDGSLCGRVTWDASRSLLFKLSLTQSF